MLEVWIFALVLIANHFLSFSSVAQGFSSCETKVQVRVWGLMLSLSSSLLSFACVLTLKGLSPVSCPILILSHEYQVGVHREGLAINAGFLSVCGF